MGFEFTILAFVKATVVGIKLAIRISKAITGITKYSSSIPDQTAL